MAAAAAAIYNEYVKARIQATASFLGVLVVKLGSVEIGGELTATVYLISHCPLTHPVCLPKVDSKKISHVMSLFSLAPYTVITCIVEDRCIVFHCIIIGNSTLTYYQPVVNTGDQ